MVKVPSVSVAMVSCVCGVTSGAAGLSCKVKGCAGKGKFLDSKRT